MKQNSHRNLVLMTFSVFCFPWFIENIGKKCIVTLSCSLPYEKQIKSTSISLYLMRSLKIDNIARLPWCTLTKHFKHVLLYLWRVASPSPQILRKHEITKRAYSQKPPRRASTALWLELDYDVLLMWSACILPRPLSSRHEGSLKGRH